MARSGGGRSWLWLQGAVAGAMVMAVPGLAILTAVMLCPVLVFYALTGPAERIVARAMLLFCISASALTLRRFWDGSATLATALDLLADPTRPLWAWAAAAAAWLACELGTVLTRLALAARTRQHLAKLRGEQERLREEWVLDDQTP